MPEIFRVVYCRERMFQIIEENVSFNLQRKIICIIQVSLWKTTYSVHSNSRSNVQRLTYTVTPTTHNVLSITWRPRRASSISRKG